MNTARTITVVLALHLALSFLGLMAYDAVHRSGDAL